MALPTKMFAPIDPASSTLTSPTASTPATAHVSQENADVRQLIVAKLKEASAYSQDLVPNGASHLENVITAGRKLREAEKLGGDLRTILKEKDYWESWALSDTSAYRYARMADHAEAIRAAGVKRIEHAHYLALTLEDAASAKSREQAKRVEAMSAAMLARHERGVFNDMRQLPAVKQATFLGDLMGRLTRLQHLFEVPAR